MNIPGRIKAKRGGRFFVVFVGMVWKWNITAPAVQGQLHEYSAFPAAPIRPDSSADDSTCAVDTDERYRVAVQNGREAERQAVQLLTVARRPKRVQFLGPFCATTPRSRGTTASP